MGIYEEMAIEKWPEFIKVTQTIPRPRIEDLEKYLSAELGKHCSIRAGDRIAVTVGSRKIDNVHTILQTTLDYLKKYGAKPFIISAMGSHGGACPEGQKDLLDSLGITAERFGVPVYYDTVWSQIGKTQSGTPVYFSKKAFEDCDGIVVVNRVKRHTNFRGPYESGLMKMLVVGMGKHKGALTVHGQGFENMSKNIEEIGRYIIGHTKVKMGIAIVENGYDEVARVEVLEPEKIPTDEPKLLKYSKSLAPRIPFNKIDLLIIMEMGKDISGDGMDTNVIGRYSSELEVDYQKTPYVRCIATLDLTDKSHGSATGVGYADIITQRLRDKIDLNISYTNCLTATATKAVKIPIIMPDDRTALEAAIKTCTGVNLDNIGICIIKNTLCLDEMYVTAPLLKEVNKDCKVITEGNYQTLDFDDHKNLNIDF